MTEYTELIVVNMRKKVFGNGTRVHRVWILYWRRAVSIRSVAYRETHRDWD